MSETMGSLFVLVKYLGALYLFWFWFGFSLLTTQSKTTFTVNKTKDKGDLAASFLAGFFLTLGDVKAIVFYVSLFPMFIDLSALKVAEILVIIFITVASIASIL